MAKIGYLGKRSGKSRELASGVQGRETGVRGRESEVRSYYSDLYPFLQNPGPLTPD